MPDTTNQAVTAPDISAQSVVTPIAPPSGAVITPPQQLQPSLGWGLPPQTVQDRAATMDLINSYPAAQTRQAVQAATRFMAQQGYQRDLQSGMPQADALAKWAPSLFFQPGVQVTPGTMASFIRAVRPQPVKAPTANPIDVTEARGIVSEMGKIQSALDDNPTGSVADDNRGKLQYLRGQLEAIRAKYNTPAAAPAPQQPQTRTAVSAPGVPAGSEQTGPNAGRVLVRRKDGKIGTVPTRRLQEYLKAGYTQVSNANP